MKKKIIIPAIIAASIFAIMSLSPSNVLAEYGSYKIPEISGSMTVTDSDYQGLEQITLSDAMSAAQDSVNNSNAMWGKLKVIQGYLVYKVGLLSGNDLFYKVIVDAGDGSILHVSDGISKNSWKHSDKSGKWKGHYVDLTPQERELKMKQWGEVKDAFFALSIDERARMIMHFMSMKAQLEDGSDGRDAKRTELKQMMKDLLPLSVEEKTEKLRKYVNSL